MEEFRVKVRRFSNKDNRVEKVNYTALIIVTLLEVLLILALSVQTFAVKTDYGMLGLIPLIVMLVGCIVNWCYYFKDKSSNKLRYIMLATYLVGYAYLMFTGTRIMVSTYIYPILVVAILYYDRKFNAIMCGIAAGISVIRALIWMPSGYLISDDEALSSIVLSCLIFWVIFIAGKTAKQFDHDAIHTMQDEKKMQDIMVQDILKISAAVRNEVVDTDQLVDNVRTSSDVVHNSIKEISVSTQVTAESVQEQTTMTSQIREAVGETAENAKIMVQAAADSAKMIDESMEVMNNMRQSAAKIGETNALVAESMSQLQEKAKEVQQITEVIFSISSQTNLLALNASIESARAGEAGKGFAVVADQIRELAEQTRQSTEKISGIIEELNVDAQNASQVVNTSIEAMSEQNEMIENASDGFVSIRDNVDTLAQKVDDIDKKIENLVSSNDTIIESISQLSATSEEVSASAQEAEERSQQNQRETQQAKQLLNKMLDTVHEFTKYQNDSQGDK